MNRVLALAALTAGLIGAQEPNLQNVEEHILPVQGSVYLLVGRGREHDAAGGQGRRAAGGYAIRAAGAEDYGGVRTLSAMPVRYIINTHVHPDHTGGNGAIAKLGGEGTIPRIIANDHVLNRMTAPAAAGQAAVPESDWPNDEYFTPTKDFFFNGEAVVVYHMPAAHTDGDSIVFFRRSDVISTGDIFTPETYPVIDLARGGSVQGIIDALNRIIELTVPAKYQEGGTYVIPGHGRLCEEADVVEYRDMVTIIRDRIQDLIRKGKTLDQVRAARPTLDYDTQYGGGADGSGTERFVEAVYRSLGGK